jgi:hypothetical protein
VGTAVKAAAGIVRTDTIKRRILLKNKMLKDKRKFESV